MSWVVGGAAVARLGLERPSPARPIPAPAQTLRKAERVITPLHNLSDASEIAMRRRRSPDSMFYASSASARSKRNVVKAIPGAAFSLARLATQATPTFVPRLHRQHRAGEGQRVRPHLGTSAPWYRIDVPASAAPRAPPRTPPPRPAQSRRLFLRRLGSVVGLMVSEDGQGRLSALRRQQRQAPVWVELPPNSLRVPTAGLSVAPSERDVQLTGGLSRGSWQESEQPRPTSGCHRRDTARCRRRSTSRNRGTGSPAPMAGGTCSPWPGRSCHSCRWDVPGGPLVTLRILMRRLKRGAVNDQLIILVINVEVPRKNVLHAEGFARRPVCGAGRSERSPWSGRADII